MILCRAGRLIPAERLPVMEHWNARATYADGTEIDKDFPYTADGNYSKECEEQYRIEAWLLEEHEGCTWYSVDYVNDD